ncbi:MULTISPECIES: hypothetical protein [Thermomonas]|uniref:hypothetical protein n=1 Tax=Thermomonas TaxID=141948 RepID=UPI0023077889|nr:hypothetical protein [Thermomonas mangrovi]
MPDTGRFEPRMPGPPDAPADWHDAFAALPTETPTPDGWQRLRARLPAAAPARPARWPWGVAMAASLLLAALLPWRLPAPSAGDPGIATGAIAVSEATPTPAQALDRAPEPARMQPVAQSTRPEARAPTLVASGTRMRPSSASGPRTTPSHPASQVATTQDAATADALDGLYARSAQLESLLALARDERVASGAAAALTETLEARVATVDAALSQPDLSTAQRTSLWDTRVEALQQLVGIEATQRLYAARGQSYDAALVTID